MGLDFYLFSLVLDRRDKDIEKRFNPHIRQTNNRKFQRVTWEQMLDMVETCSVKDLSIIQNYIGNKTIGYNREQRLQRAFLSRATSYNIALPLRVAESQLMMSDKLVCHEVDATTSIR